MKHTHGFTLVELMIVVAIIGIIVGIAIPNILEGRKSANESSAVGSLRTIATVQAQYQSADTEQDGALDYATNLKELADVGLVDRLLGDGSKSGYVFSLSGDTYNWQCSATPQNSNVGTRNFIVCTDGVVRFSGAGTPATCSGMAIQ